MGCIAKAYGYTRREMGTARDKRSYITLDPARVELGVRDDWCVVLVAGVLDVEYAVCCDRFKNKVAVWKACRHRGTCSKAIRAPESLLGSCFVWSRKRSWYKKRRRCSTLLLLSTTTMLRQSTHRRGARSVAQPNQRSDHVTFNDPSTLTRTRPIPYSHAPDTWSQSFPPVQQQLSLPPQQYTPVQIPQHQPAPATTLSVSSAPINSSFALQSDPWMWGIDNEFSPTDSESCVSANAATRLTLRSPADTLMSPGSDASVLPTYGSSEADPSGYQDNKLTIPEDDFLSVPMFNPFGGATEPQQAGQGPVVTVDPLQLSTNEKSAHDLFAQPGQTKPRSAHRKAIEEKSSIKRKNAEHRLVTAISNRLGGTFVPGLANQLNQAAELLE
jgi:hypothetical protein